jgi:orotate phosphoribosyltransferase
MREYATVLTEEPVKYALDVFKLTADGNQTFATTTSRTGVPLDRTHYSEFKYGRRDLAEYYGGLIAEVLISHLSEILHEGEEVVVMGTPYKRLPNAARMLAITAENYLRLAGLPTCYTYIYQHRLAGGDYGKLDSAARDRRNQLKKRFIDAEDFEGRHVVVIDDVRITGSIERSIFELLKDMPILSSTFVNLVKMDEHIALANPCLENKLNHHAVNSLQDIIRIMHGPHGFVLITRVLKYILESGPSELRWFLEQLSVQEITSLFEGIIDDGYDVMPQYHDSFRIIRDTYMVCKPPLSPRPGIMEGMRHV